MVPHAPKTPPVERRKQGDRRRASHYRFANRRTAFDRRRRYPVLGPLRDSSWLLLAVLIAANLLCNPVLAPLYATSPYLAVVFKVAVVALVSIGIWHQRRYRYVLAVSLLALAIFTGLLAYHLGSLRGLGYL